MNRAFEVAFTRTMKHEGGYVNDPFDPGQETFCGISRFYWPNWEGWIVIDNHIPDETYGTDETLTQLVKCFYRENFWDRVQGDMVAPLSLEVACELFDTAVNLGVADAIRFMQSSLNMLNQYGTTYPDIQTDGKLGPVTLETLDRYLNTQPGLPEENEQILSNCMNGEQYIAYKENPRHEHFRGLFKRV